MVLKNGKTSSLYYPYIKKGEVKKIMTVDEVYENIFN